MREVPKESWQERLIPAHRALLDEIAAIVKAELGENLVELRLYGSVARGEAREESDLDLVAVVRKPVPKDVRRRIADKIWEKELEWGGIVHLAYVTLERYEKEKKVHGDWLGAVAEEGVVI